MKTTESQTLDQPETRLDTRKYNGKTKRQMQIKKRIILIKVNIT